MRHIDVKANLRQISAKFGQGESVVQNPVFEWGIVRLGLSKKIANKINTNMSGPQEADHDEGRGYGVQSLFTVGRKTH